MGKSTGPATFKLRLRSPAGGEGKLEWLPGGAADSAGSQSVAFTAPVGEWSELSVDVPATGTLGVVRLYLPASDKPLELDWVALFGKSADSKPQRWEFNAK